MEILIAVVALAVGGAVGWLAASLRAGTLRTRIGVLESRIVENEKTASRRYACGASPP